jgi:hypothetical protein
MHAMPVAADGKQGLHAVDPDREKREGVKADNAVLSTQVCGATGVGRRVLWKRYRVELAFHDTDCYIPLVRGLAGSVVGCGPGVQQGPLAEDKDAGKIIAEGARKSYQQSKPSNKMVRRRGAFPPLRPGHPDMHHGTDANERTFG